MTAVSERLFDEVFGNAAPPYGHQVKDVDLVKVTERLAYFTMENPDLCRSWFLHVLSMRNPETDPFWREYFGSLTQFVQTDLAEPGVDAEVWSIILLAGNLLWPVWAHTRMPDKIQRRALAKRFARELLRLSMHGVINASKFPDIAMQVGGGFPDRPTFR